MAFFLMGKRKEKKKLGIYVHIPFCKSKCEYCDFYSIGGGRDKRLTDDYLQTLADHIKETGALAPDYRVDTVYFGGGTPSFFGAENLEKILDEIHRHFRLTSNAEITAEANPDSVTLSGLRRMLRAGFNRLSIGVQSDDDEMLKKLGRPHNFQQAKQAMELARKAGFANISLDLMYGLPNQTVSQWKETVLNIISLRPEHISCYGLKVEENTPLWSYKDCANLPSDDAQAQMYLEVVKLLEEYGYEQYEISNFAKKGFHSRHNMKYWTGEEYLGFRSRMMVKRRPPKSEAALGPKRYISGIANEQAVLDENEEIPMRERAGEYIMLRLRTAQGICREEYEKQYLLPFRPLEEELRHYADNGLAKQVGKRWRLTPSGWLLSNQIILQLLEIQSKAGTLSKKTKE